MLPGARKGLIASYSNEGYLSQAEAEVLLGLVDELKTDLPIVEIGVWAGKTTALLGEYLKMTGRKNQMIGIDPFETLDTDPNLRPNLGKTESVVAHLDNVRLMIGLSTDQDIVKAFPQVSLLFVDGDHSLEGCEKDILNWLPKVEEIAVFHDCVTHKGVAEALKKNNVTYEVMAENLGIVRINNA